MRSGPPPLPELGGNDRTSLAFTASSRADNANCSRSRVGENRKKPTTLRGGFELSDEHQSDPGGGGEWWGVARGLATSSAIITDDYRRNVFSQGRVWRLK